VVDIKVNWLILYYVSIFHLIFTVTIIIIKLLKDKYIYIKLNMNTIGFPDKKNDVESIR
jgi:hypothetical protein